MPAFRIGSEVSGSGFRFWVLGSKIWFSGSAYRITAFLVQRCHAWCSVSGGWVLVRGFVFRIADEKSNTWFRVSGLSCSRLVSGFGSQVSGSGFLVSIFGCQVSGVEFLLRDPFSLDFRLISSTTDTIVSFTIHGFEFENSGAGFRVQSRVPGLNLDRQPQT